MEHGKKLAAGERFDGGAGFFDAFVPQSAQVHLAIDWWRLAKDEGPIDVLVNKNRVRIAGDGKKKRAAVRTRQFAEALVISERIRIRRRLFRHDRLAREDERRATFHLVRYIGHVVRHPVTIHKMATPGSDVFPKRPTLFWLPLIDSRIVLRARRLWDMVDFDHANARLTIFPSD